MTKNKWFSFEIYHNGQYSYIGKCYTNESNICKSIPYSKIVGTLVTIYTMK